jgi:hypothetical protein
MRSHHRKNWFAKSLFQNCIFRRRFYLAKKPSGKNAFYFPFLRTCSSDYDLHPANPLVKPKNRRTRRVLWAKIGLCGEVANRRATFETCGQRIGFAILRKVLAQTPARPGGVGVGSEKLPTQKNVFQFCFFRGRFAPCKIGGRKNVFYFPFSQSAFSSHDLHPANPPVKPNVGADERVLSQKIALCRELAADRATLQTCGAAPPFALQVDLRFKEHASLGI